MACTITMTERLTNDVLNISVAISDAIPEDAQALPTIMALARNIGVGAGELAARGGFALEPSLSEINEFVCEQIRRSAKVAYEIAKRSPSDG